MYCICIVHEFYLSPKAIAVSYQRMYSPPNPPIKSSARFNFVSQSVTLSDIS